jgi:poly(3-hydroxybutyrate) depolymerase
VVVLLAVLAAGLAGVGVAVTGGDSSAVSSHLRGRVRVWVVPYRAFDGKTRRVFVDLPRWYGPKHDPALPLVISPHGRQALAQANSALWGQLPAQGVFAVANPEGQGRVLGDESWGYAGQISDLARMPALVHRALRWLRVDRRRVYAVGGSMGGQEVLLLLARHPRLLAGVVTFDAPTDLAARYYALARLRDGSRLQALMRREVGATPTSAPRLYQQRSPLSFAAGIASSRVPVELWWSRRDHVVTDQASQSGRLYRLIRKLAPRARVRQVIGDWPHMAEMSWRRGLPAALRWLGLLEPQSRSLAETAIRRSSLPATKSPCDSTRGGPLAYAWPVKPFGRQHPVRGYFGDPRTLGLERLGADKQGSLGSFTFHNGVDISASPGTRVYPVVSGVAHVGSGDQVTVTTGDGRTFQYFHITPAVRPGQRVSADRTVLGRVKRIWDHVHLTEIDDFTVHNPLDPGHLHPFHDHTVPHIDGLSFTSDTGARLDPRHLHGTILIAAQAEDTTPLAVPGDWFGFPVTPALITWKLTSPRGHTVRRVTVADFRHTEPPHRDFWHVYAAGTYQNFPDFAHHFYWHLPGRYLFTLTPTPLTTRHLVNGSYHITITAADTCGNRSTLTEPLQITNTTHPPQLVSVSHRAPTDPQRPNNRGRIAAAQNAGEHG